MDFIWESIVLILAGMVLLRFAGRKSIAQMSITTTVVMISIGTIIVQPIVEKTVWKAAASGALFIIVLILVEYLQVKFNFFEKLMFGKGIVVIENGQPNEKNMRKIRMSIDKLEMHLRQNGIARFKDLKTATIEPNGQLGYELAEDEKPLTAGQFKKMMQQYIVMQNENQTQARLPEQGSPFDLFDEAKYGKHDKNIPKELQ